MIAWNEGKLWFQTRVTICADLRQFKRFVSLKLRKKGKRIADKDKKECPLLDL